MSTRWNSWLILSSYVMRRTLYLYIYDPWEPRPSMGNGRIHFTLTPDSRLVGWSRGQGGMADTIRTYIQCACVGMYVYSCVCASYMNISRDSVVLSPAHVPGVVLGLRKTKISRCRCSPWSSAWKPRGTQAQHRKTKNRTVRCKWSESTGARFRKDFLKTVTLSWILKEKHMLAGWGRKSTPEHPGRGLPCLEAGRVEVAHLEPTSHAVELECSMGGVT